jgi:hypothetical protein
MATPANWYAGPSGTGMNGPVGTKQYDAAFFLDNEQRHIDTVGSCMGITARKVPGSERIMAIPFTHFLSEKYIQSLSPQGQQAAFILKTIMRAFEANPLEYYDFGSGIQQEDVDVVKAWVQEQKAQGKKDLAVLFDWDRTITFIEGFMPLPPGFGAPAAEYVRQWVVQAPFLQSAVDLLPQTSVEGFVEYYVGGPKRLQMLQELMAYLTKEGVDICILTNNPSCFKYTIPFEQMTMVVTNNVPVTFICAANYPTKKNALITNAKAKTEFQRLCSAVVGNPGAGAGARGGKRKTRKRKA